MPFHPNGLDHETLKKLAKNLKKGFPKVFPNTPCTTSQSQALLAVELGYEHWHEAINARDPSLLATNADMDAPPSLDDLLVPLRAALPQGALLITGWDSARNAELFKVLRQHGQEDHLIGLNPIAPAVFVPSIKVKIFMKVEDPTETFDLFKQSVEQAHDPLHNPTMADPTTFQEDITAEDKGPPSPEASAERSSSLWRDPEITALVFEGLHAYLKENFAGTDALRNLAHDLRHLGHSQHADHILEHWLPHFLDDQIGQWVHEVARELMPRSKRAAHALLRTAHMGLASTFERGLGTVASLLREDAQAWGQSTVRSTAWEASRVPGSAHGGTDLPVAQDGEAASTAPLEPLNGESAPTPSLEAAAHRTETDAETSWITAHLAAEAFSGRAWRQDLTHLGSSMRQIVKQTVDQALADAGDLRNAIALFSQGMANRPDQEMFIAMDALRRAMAEQVPSLAMPFPDPGTGEKRQLTTVAKKTMIRLLRENDPGMAESRRNAMIRGLVHPLARPDARA